MIDTNTYEPKTATVRARYIALYGQHGTLSGCNIGESRVAGHSKDAVSAEDRTSAAYGAL